MQKAAGRNTQGSNGRRAPRRDQRVASPCAPVCKSLCVLGEGGGGVASNPRCVTRADAPCRQRALRTESDSDSGFGFGFQSCAAPGGRQLTVMGGFPTSIPGRDFARSLSQEYTAVSCCGGWCKRLALRACASAVLEYGLGTRGAARAHGRRRTHRSKHRTGPYRRRVPKTPRPRQVKHVRIPIRPVR